MFMLHVVYMRVVVPHERCVLSGFGCSRANCKQSHHVDAHMLILKYCIRPYPVTAPDAPLLGSRVSLCSNISHLVLRC
jgi:hypothetical protein